MVKALDDIGLLMRPVIANSVIIPDLIALLSVKLVVVDQPNDGTYIQT